VNPNTPLSSKLPAKHQSAASVQISTASYNPQTQDMDAKLDRTNSSELPLTHVHDVSVGQPSPRARI